jgi:hypothetical protein
MGKASWEVLRISPAASEALSRLAKLRRYGRGVMARRSVVTDFLQWMAGLPDAMAALFANDVFYFPDEYDERMMHRGLNCGLDFYLKAPLHDLVVVASALPAEAITRLKEAAYEMLLRTDGQAVERGANAGGA